MAEDISWFSGEGVGDFYTPSSTVNVEDSLGSLFKEIGNTLVSVTKQGISTLGDTVKQSLANQVMTSPQGQTEIAKYKMQYFINYLPWIVIGAVALFIGGRYFARS